MTFFLHIYICIYLLNKSGIYFVLINRSIPNIKSNLPFHQSQKKVIRVVYGYNNNNNNNIMMSCSIYIRNVGGNIPKYLYTLNPCTFCCIGRLPTNRDVETFVLSAKSCNSAVTYTRSGVVTGYKGWGIAHDKYHDNIISAVQKGETAFN